MNVSRKVSIARERVSDVVIFASQPLIDQLCFCLELEHGPLSSYGAVDRTMSFFEVRAIAPAGSCGVIALRKDTGFGWQIPFEEVEPRADEGAQELQKVDGGAAEYCVRN
jgi:hypothetical protein